MASGCKIGPSILNSDLASLGAECLWVLDSGADYLHLDASCSSGRSVFYMHMMVSKPEQWVKPMAVAGANQYTFHLEATENPGALIKDTRENGMKVGLAIKPGTSVHWLRTQFPSLDIEVDGRVGSDTVHKCAEAGANMIVSGSAIMRSEDPRSVINLLRNVCSDAAQKRSLDR
ncbi:ribulose-phosphate 3-epimerase-like isoform X3 [Pongo pygmaeus]|uniref:ribulose-phosphate 3-epimerase-like isoform X3 n=1 Tax=Pongo pygmaeus TaxID=9600 RepID=UPI0023E16CC8|nr:ribulose-phosphate 3-epimerase-like isoform X3 [Pongo pygmaeus]